MSANEARRTEGLWVNLDHLESLVHRLHKRASGITPPADLCSCARLLRKNGVQTRLFNYRNKGFGTSSFAFVIAIDALEATNSAPVVLSGLSRWLLLCRYVITRVCYTAKSCVGAKRAMKLHCDTSGQPPSSGGLVSLAFLYLFLVFSAEVVRVICRRRARIHSLVLTRAL